MPTKTQSTVVAVFRNRSDAEAAASDLKANGFGSNEIFLSSDSSAVDATTQPGGVYSDTDVSTHHHHEGGIVGWFKSVFGQEEDGDRSYYENAANSGHTFLSVDVTPETVDRTAAILNSHNPVDVHREEGSGQIGTADTSARSPAPSVAGGAGTVAGARTGVGDSEAIPVVQEELKVGKRAVLKGGVRVYSRVVDQPVEETVRLHDETVRVDRTPVNREATAADLRPGKEQVFEVKEFGEEAVVSKTARVVEEVRIHKDATEHTETVRDNVRHTEVNVENVAPGTTGASTGTAAGTALGANEQDPGYLYGSQMANDPRYRGRSFDEVEPQLRSDYAGRYPNSTWERTKDTVRRGWDKVTGKV